MFIRKRRLTTNGLRSNRNLKVSIFSRNSSEYQNAATFMEMQIATKNTLISERMRSNINRTMAAPGLIIKGPVTIVRTA